MTVRLHPSKATTLAFLVSLATLALSVCLAIGYLVVGSSAVGYAGVGLMLFGLGGLYGSLERADHELQSA